jgi:hypothetical protein
MIKIRRKQAQPNLEMNKGNYVLLFAATHPWWQPSVLFFSCGWPCVIVAMQYSSNLLTRMVTLSNTSQIFQAIAHVIVSMQFSSNLLAWMVTLSENYVTLLNPIPWWQPGVLFFSCGWPSVTVSMQFNFLQSSYQNGDIIKY